MKSKIANIRRHLLDWYQQHQRQLPWRASQGTAPNPYHVWLSEMMLQQTTVATVRAYFLAFTTKWPDITALARASREEIMAAWSGLGYYARARNLHRCAEIITQDYGGVLPNTEAELLKLPGIGAYSAAAIAAIAFNQPASPVDANIERVVARLYGIETPLPAAKKIIKQAAITLTPSNQAGDMAQAMMDFGSQICTARKPACGICPLQADCQAYASGNPESLPVKPKKTPRPKRHLLCLWVTRTDGAIWLWQRPDSGMLGGMLECPNSDWQDGALPRQPRLSNELKQYLKDYRANPIKGRVRHVFSHFEVECAIWHVTVPRTYILPHGAFYPKADLPKLHLSTLMRKIATLVEKP